MSGAAPDPGGALPARALASLAFGVALVPLNSTMIAVALPAIGRDVSAPAAALTQWLVTSYLLVNIVLQSPAGKLGDLFGHTRALALGRLLFAAGSVAGFLARGLPLLVVARLLMATGGAIIVPASTALLRSRLPEARRAQAFGLFGGVMGLAAAAGPLLGGEIAARLGWSWLFLVNAPPLVLSALLAQGGGDGPPRASPRFDVLGSALLGAGLVLLVLATRGSARAAPLAAGGAALLAAFALWERRARDPVVDPALFARPVFAAGTLLAGFQNLAMYALVFSLPITFARAFGAGSAEAGRALLALTGAMVVCSPLGGRLAGRVGARRTALLGCGLSLVGMVLLGALPLSAPSDTAAGLALLGAGLGLASPSAQSSAMSAAPPEQAGMAAGVSSTMRYLGGVAGVAIVGGLVEGGDPLAQHRLGTAVFGAALAAAMACAAFLPERVSGGRQ